MGVTDPFHGYNYTTRSLPPLSLPSIVEVSTPKPLTMDCGTCGKVFSRVDTKNRQEFARPRNKRRHEETCKGIPCGKCETIFNNRRNLKRHEFCETLPLKKSQAQPEINSLVSKPPDLEDVSEYETSFEPCTHCGFVFNNRHNLKRHEEFCEAPLPKTSRAEPEINSLVYKTLDAEGNICQSQL